MAAAVPEPATKPHGRGDFDFQVKLLLLGDSAVGKSESRDLDLDFRLSGWVSPSGSAVRRCGHSNRPCRAVMRMQAAVFSGNVRIVAAEVSWIGASAPIENRCPSCLVLQLVY
jgi:hypothetical protein